MTTKKWCHNVELLLLTWPANLHVARKRLILTFENIHQRKELSISPCCLHVEYKINQKQVNTMDAATIQDILEAGKIGDMPFPAWFEQVGPVIDINETHDLLKPLAKVLSEVRVADVRWETSGAGSDKLKTWRAYLVITLPSTPVISPRSISSSLASPIPFPHSQPSLKLIHDIAVEKCGSFFYFVRGQELWVEYLVAFPEDRRAIEAELEVGKIGEMPFPIWLQYEYSPVSSTGIAQSLAALGVTAVRWEQDKHQEQLAKSGIGWYSYLVVTLPTSSSASPPSLPSDRLVSRINLTLHNPHSNTTRVTDNGVEAWFSFHVELPLDGRAVALLEGLDFQ